MIYSDSTPEQRAQAMQLVIQAMPHLADSFIYDEFIIMSALTLEFLVKGEIPKDSDWNRILEVICDIRQAETATKN